MKLSLEDIVRAELAGSEHDLVELRVGGSKSRPLVEVRVERKDGAAVTVDDCAQVSRRIEARLDGSGVLSDRYVLQVSSPGDRPLRTASEWRRFVGRWASVLAPEHGGRFEARIVAVGGTEGGEFVTLEEHGRPRDVPLAAVKDARLAIRI